MMKRSGFSLAEMLIVMGIMAVVMLVIMPSMTKTKNSTTLPPTRICIANESAASFNFTAGAMAGAPSTACKTVIDDCKNEQGTMCSDAKTYLGAGGAQAVAVEKILRAACDGGGQTACNYFVDKCVSAGTCNVTGNANEQDYLDLHYYMTLPKYSVSNSGKAKIMAYTATKYVGTASIYNEVEAATTCDLTNPDTACEFIYNQCNFAVTRACQYFADKCKNSGLAYCDPAGYFDVAFYLNLPTTDSNSGRSVIYNYIKNTAGIYTGNVSTTTHAICTASAGTTACQLVSDLG